VLLTLPLLLHYERNVGLLPSMVLQNKMPQVIPWCA